MGDGLLWPNIMSARKHLGQVSQRIVVGVADGGHQCAEALVTEEVSELGGSHPAGEEWPDGPIVVVQRLEISAVERDAANPPVRRQLGRANPSQGGCAFFGLSQAPHQADGTPGGDLFDLLAFTVEGIGIKGSILIPELLPE